MAEQGLLAREHPVRELQFELEERVADLPPLPPRNSFCLWWQLQRLRGRGSGSGRGLNMRLQLGGLVRRNGPLFRVHHLLQVQEYKNNSVIHILGF